MCGAACKHEAPRCMAARAACVRASCKGRIAHVQNPQTLFVAHLPIINEQGGSGPQLLSCSFYSFPLGCGHRSLLSLNPEDRPSADKVLASQLLNKKPASTLLSQSSTVSAQSALTSDGGKYGGLVLQRSVHT
jgi:hypothetical protein